MYCAVSSSSRISSTLVLVAASTSSMSTKRPESISVQARHLPQGREETPVSQLIDLARMRASVVLPTPRVPVKRYAWCRRPVSSALASAVTTCGCPTSWSNALGRHLRASTWYVMESSGGTAAPGATDGIGKGEPDPRHLKESTMAASFPT